MGYATGIANNVSDLLSAIESFALSDGWTIDSGKATRSDGTAGQAVNISKGDVHGAFYSYDNSGTESDPGRFIGAYCYPSYSIGSGNMAQANPSAKILANGLGSGPFIAHHLFGGPQSLHVVVETVAGTFKHFGIGQVHKLGSVVDGVYAFASRWFYSGLYVNTIDSSYHAVPFDCGEYLTRIGQSLTIRADSDGLSPRWLDPMDGGSSNTNRVICGWRDVQEGYQSAMVSMEPSTLTGRAPLWPVLLSADRGSGMFSPFGIAPDIRFVRLDNLAPGDAITLGADTWRVFPVIRKNGTAGDVNSGTYGYAYLQRP